MDPHAEYRAAQEGAALVDMSSRETVRITGEDRVAFLHGMVTNEVKALPDGGLTYAALLTPKGAMVADARILRRPDELLLDTEPGMGAAVREFLGKYLISEEAEIHDATPSWAALALHGPRSAEVAGRASLAERFQQVALGNAQVLLLPSHLPGRPGVDLLVPRQELPAISRWLVERGAMPIGLSTWQVLRVEAGVPRFGQDMEESTIPLEANLERAISYRKGCYIGQEVIARATFRGHVNRKLTGLLLGDHAPAPKTELKKGEKKVGWLTSVVRSPSRSQVVALGYVHRDHLEPGTQLELAGGGTATVHPLPFTH